MINLYLNFSTGHSTNKTFFSSFWSCCSMTDSAKKPTNYYTIGVFSAQERLEIYLSHNQSTRIVYCRSSQLFRQKLRAGQTHIHNNDKYNNNNNNSNNNNNNNNNNNKNNINNIRTQIENKNKNKFTILRKRVNTKSFASIRAA